jgi:hypothetical protein
MRIILLGLGLLASLGLPVSVQAQSPAFDDLSNGDAANIIGEFSANFVHTTVSGASPLGTLFGFDVGLVAGLTQTSEIDRLTQAANANSSASQIYHGAIIGMVSVPFGITVEGSFIPNVGSSDFRFHNVGLGAKWSLTSSIIELPLSLALRGHFMSTSLSFDQTVVGVESTVSLEDKVLGLQALASKALSIGIASIEPFVGLGYISGDGSLSVTGAGALNVFYNGAVAYSSRPSSAQFLVGGEAQIMFAKVGFEYSRQFNVNRYTGKLAVSF